jgi:outer membrane protein assembly factor BamB
MGDIYNAPPPEAPDNMRIDLCLAIMFGLLCVSYVRAAEPADWPCNRQNGTLDAHSPAKGQIVSPKIAWSCYVGREEYAILAEPGDQPSELTVPPSEFAGSPAVLSDARWGLTPPSGQVAGAQQSIEKTSSVLYADILTDVPGLEKVEFESAFSLPTVNGQYSKAKARCLAWRQGAWQAEWETPPMPEVFLAMPLVGDFDHDGAQEIVFLPWKELIVLDARTGNVKYRCKFTEGRSYGFLGHYDLDGDGTSEFIVQADFCKHVEVLGFRDGALKLLWQKEIELDIADPQKILRVNPNPVADIDADGKLEVSTCTFNDSLAHAWQVDFHDGLTGAVKHSLPNSYLEGLVDLDGDGTAEVLVSPTAGAGISQDGPARVFAVRAGQMQMIWEGAGLAWQRWEPPVSDNVNSGATLPKRTALCRADASGAIAVFSRPADDRVISARWTNGAFAPVCEITSAAAEVQAVSLDGAMLASVSGAGPVSTPSGALSLVDRQKRGIPLSPLSIVHPANSDQPVIAAQGSGEEIVLLHPPTAQAPATEFRRVSSRSQGERWPDSSGPVCADLAGNGNFALLYATASDAGSALMVAEDVVSGQRLWSHEFAEIPGTAPVWNTGGIILWQAGHFTSLDKRDVLVTVRRSMMHSEETFLLSGQDGRELWRRNRQISQRGVGGTPFAVADFDGDELDDAALLHPSIFYILKGATGTDLLAKDATWEPIPSKPVYWGRPVAVRLDPTAPASVFMAGTGMTALIERDGALRWWDALDKSQAAFAFGDFDGDGQNEAIGAGYEDGIRCYDVQTGAVEWKVPLPVPGTPVGAASADLDGDGRDEAVFSAGNTVYAIGVRPGSTTGQQLWRVDVPVAVGAPCIASLSTPEDVVILVSGADGRVFCVK